MGTPLSLASLLVLSAVLTGSAQTQPPDAPSKAGPAGEEITYRGCLTATVPERPTSAQPRSIVHLRTGEKGRETTVTLVTAPDADVDLATHDRKLVEVRGIEYREGMAAGDDESRVQGGRMQDVGQAAIVEPPSRVQGSKDDEGPRRTLQVSRLRVIADTCPAP